MSDFKSRLFVEEQELSHRLSRLQAFMGTDAFKQMRVDDWLMGHLLQDQERAMAEYQRALRERIKLIEDRELKANAEA